MALAKQVAHVNRIARAKQVLNAHGFTLLESEPYSEVNRVHTPGSYHYDKIGKQTLAVDVNWDNQREEKSKLNWARKVLQSYGLGVIHNSPGHYTHTHGDVGAHTRVNGRASKTKTKTTLQAYRTEKLQAAVRMRISNLWSGTLDKRLNAVKAASRYGKTKFPYGIKYTQAVIGAKQTGKWDLQSRAKHDETVLKIEKALGFSNPDTTWTSSTSKGVAKAKREATK